ncbi:MAG: MFS transporter [Flavobacteriia bacterium]|nr:MFS transporter [Flavobacteriia bacterium]
MEVEIKRKSHVILAINTITFSICFAVWMLNGVLVTFLVEKGIYDWSPIQVGWLMGVPVLTGAVLRLPMGILTDKYGGKWVFVLLLLACSIPVFLLSFADSFTMFLLLSFGVGIAGSGFAVGVAYTSVWYPKHWQGRALGIFGAGNAGAALTTILAPTMLNKLTKGGEYLDGWRVLPMYYAFTLVFVALIFIFFTENKKAENPPKKLNQLLKPLGSLRVWRFGLYYFLVFGCFVAFSQWLVPYFVNVYGLSLVAAGLLASLFSMPSGIIRILGGWISDKWGARQLIFNVFLWSIAISFLLIIPKMDIFSPGNGIQSKNNGKVTFVSEDKIIIDTSTYFLKKAKYTNSNFDEKTLILPKKDNWQTAVVKEGQEVKKKELIAKGTTKIHFQANVWIFTILVTLIGIVWGIGKAGVYKFIPDYFPDEVGVVGGMVGVIGGLGGFVCPIVFGYLLEWTGVWTSSWMLMLFVSILCYIWMKRVVRNLVRKHAPNIADDIEYVKK